MSTGVAGLDSGGCHMYVVILRCNYQTYILYHLPKLQASRCEDRDAVDKSSPKDSTKHPHNISGELQVHDQMHVDAEAHQVAEAAYAKKRHLALTAVTFTADNAL